MRKLRRNKKKSLKTFRIEEQVQKKSLKITKNVPEWGEITKNVPDWGASADPSVQDYRQAKDTHRYRQGKVMLLITSLNKGKEGQDWFFSLSLLKFFKKARTASILFWKF